jgi:hypothetical protein
MSDELCEQCQHPSGPHAVLAPTEQPSDGGIMLCTEPGCPCFSTWSLEGYPLKWKPTEEEVAELRRDVQKREVGGSDTQVPEKPQKADSSGSSW